MNWTDEMVSILKSHVAAGMSARQISVAMGMTRNSIIGKIHREGLKLAASPVKPPPKYRHKQVPADVLATILALGREGHSLGRIEVNVAQQHAYSVGHGVIRRLLTEHGINPREARGSAAQAERALAAKAAKARAETPPKARGWQDRFMPIAQTPVPFGQTKDGQCRAFLPGEPVGPTGLVCGNPFDPAAREWFCAECRKHMFEKVVRTGKPRDTQFMSPRTARAA